MDERKKSQGKLEKKRNWTEENEMQHIIMDGV